MSPSLITDPFAFSLNESVELVGGGDGALGASGCRGHAVEALHVLLEVRVALHVQLLCASKQREPE